MPDMAQREDPVGIIEIAERLDYPVRTVHQWNFREVLPPPDYDSVNGGQAWHWRTILRWAGESGRLDRRPALVAEFDALPKPRRRGRQPSPASR